MIRILQRLIQLLVQHCTIHIYTADSLMNVYFHYLCSVSSHVGKLQKRVLTQQVCLHYHMSNYSWFQSRSALHVSFCCTLYLLAFSQEVDRMLASASRARSGNDLFRTLGDNGESSG